MFKTLDEALNDRVFCEHIDLLDLNYCYRCLEYSESRYDLYRLLDGEGINPFYDLSRIPNNLLRNSNIVKVDIPPNVEIIGSGAFCGCKYLTSVAISDSVTLIGERAFEDCVRLKSAMIPDSVISIGNNAFEHCPSLISVVIPNSVTSIGNGAFASCTNLTSVTIGSGVTSINMGIFHNCENLISVTIPDSITSIDSSAFYYCPNLHELTYGGTKEDWKHLAKPSAWRRKTDISVINCKDGVLRV